MADLKVSDDEFENYKNVLTEFYEKAEDKLSRYIGIMRNVRETAIIDGVLGDRLDEFINSTQTLLSGAIKIQSLDTIFWADRYIQQIDEADEVLY